MWYLKTACQFERVAAYFPDSIFSEMDDFQVWQMKKRSSWQRRYLVAIEVEFTQTPQSSERAFIDMLNVVSPQN